MNPTLFHLIFGLPADQLSTANSRAAIIMELQEMGNCGPIRPSPKTPFISSLCVNEVMFCEVAQMEQQPMHQILDNYLLHQPPGYSDVIEIKCIHLNINGTMGGTMCRSFIQMTLHLDH